MGDANIWQVHQLYTAAAKDDANEGWMRRHVLLGVLVMYVYESSEACFIQKYTMNNLHSFKFYKVNEAKRFYIRVQYIQGNRVSTYIDNR